MKKVFKKIQEGVEKINKDYHTEMSTYNEGFEDGISTGENMWRDIREALDTGEGNNILNRIEEILDFYFEDVVEYLPKGYVEKYIAH